MSRSLDFTACTRECATNCWRKLTEQEKWWLATNPNLQAYSDFKECPDYQPVNTETEKEA